MILPQSEAFFMLHHRLSAIPLNSNHETKKNQVTKSDLRRDQIDFKELFQYFIDTQEKHKEQKHKQRQTLIINPKEMTNLEI
jgi:hypothetical protein